MALSNASRLSDFGSGIGTQGAVIQVDNSNQAVGIGTTNPTRNGLDDATLKVGQYITFGAGGNINATGTGIVTATEFYGSGVNLTGLSIIKKKIDSTQGTLGNLMYKTPYSYSMTGISSVYVVSDTTSGNVVFTRLGEIAVGSAATLHIGSGTTLAMDVLSLF